MANTKTLAALCRAVIDSLNQSVEEKIKNLSQIALRAQIDLFFLLLFSFVHAVGLTNHAPFSDTIDRFRDWWCLSRIHATGTFWCLKTTKETYFLFSPASFCQVSNGSVGVRVTGYASKHASSLTSILVSIRDFRLQIRNDHRWDSTQ